MTELDRLAGGGRFRRVALYGASRTVVEALFGIRGIALAAVLGPALFGIWTLFRLTLRYGALLALGVFRGLELKVSDPRNASIDARRSWGRVTAGYVIGVYGACGVVAGAVSLGLESPIRETVWAGGIGLLVERLWMYAASYLRAEGQLRRYAVLELLQAASSLALTASMAVFWGLPGAYTGFLLAMVGGIALLGRSVPLRPLHSREKLRELLRIGMPLSLSTVGTILLTTVDRWVVAGMEGTVTLGLYGFAVAVSGLGASAAWVVRTVVFPEVYARAHRDGGEAAAASHLVETVLPTAMLLPPLLGLVGIALGPVVAIAAPQYLEVLPVARLFVFTGVGAGFVTLGTLSYVATDRQRLLPVLTFAGLVGNAGLAVFALEAGYGLSGVALGALVSRSLTGASVVAISVSKAKIQRSGALLVQLLWPLAWCATVVWFVGRWQTGVDIPSTAAAMAVYVLALAPILPSAWAAVRRATE